MATAPNTHHERKAQALAERRAFTAYYLGDDMDEAIAHFAAAGILALGVQRKAQALAGAYLLCARFGGVDALYRASEFAGEASEYRNHMCKMEDMIARCGDMID